MHNVNLIVPMGTHTVCSKRMFGLDRQPSGAPHEAILKTQTFNKIKVCTEVLNYAQIEKYVSPAFYVKFNIDTCAMSFPGCIHTKSMPLKCGDIAGGKKRI